jgi:hypothetical protein
MMEPGSWQNATRPGDETKIRGGVFRRLWEGAKRVVTRSAFWPYERGGWQYDVIVIVILAFIFLTPRSWYDDRPTLQLTDLRHRQGFVEVGRGKDGWRYLIDSRLVESFDAQKPEAAIQEILHRRLNRPFKIQSIDLIRDKNNVMLGYTVVVSQ